jgi:hypothetical protein
VNESKGVIRNVQYNQVPEKSKHTDILTDTTYAGYVRVECNVATGDHIGSRHAGRFGAQERNEDRLGTCIGEEFVLYEYNYQLVTALI